MYNSGVTAIRANEGGTMGKRKTAASPLTAARAAAVKELKANAVAHGMSIDAYITALLCDPKTTETLLYYIRSKFETPFSSPQKIAMQAVLMRFADVATLAKALNVSDDEALIELENAEYQAIQTNHPDKSILPLDIQAALTIAVKELIDAGGRFGLPATTPGLLAAMKVATGDSWDASPSQILLIRNSGSGAANNADGGIDLSAITGSYQDVDTSGVYNDNSGASDSGGGWDWGSIFSTINSALGVVKNAASTVKTVTGSVSNGINTVGGALNTQVSNIGGQSINKSSLPWIIGGGILLIVVVIVILYAARK